MAATAVASPPRRLLQFRSRTKLPSHSIKNPPYQRCKTKTLAVRNKNKTTHRAASTESSAVPAPTSSTRGGGGSGTFPPPELSRSTFSTARRIAWS